MRRFAVLLRMLLTVQRRNRATLFWNMAFPVGLILLYGAIWGGQRIGGVDTTAWLMVGVVVLNVMSRGLIGSATWLTNLRERSILLRVRATPLPTAVLVSAYLLMELILILVESALIVAVAMLVYGAPLAWSGLGPAFGFFLLGTAVFLALGQAIAAVAPDSRASMALGQVLYFPLMFVSNLFLPIDTLPRWLAGLARWSPAYLLVDLVRPALVGVPAMQALGLDLGGLLIYGLLGMILAVCCFRWEPQQ